MDKKNIDWSNLGFGYICTDKRYVANYKDGAWDEGMLTSDAVLAAFTRDALKIYMAVVGLFGIQMACQITFGALGNAKASILVAVMRKFVLLIPLIYIMPHIFRADQTMAVYLAEPVADFLAVSFTSVLFLSQFQKMLSKNVSKNTEEKTIA